MILLIECCGCGMVFNHDPKKFLQAIDDYRASSLPDLEQMGFTCFNCTKDLEQPKAV